MVEGFDISVSSKETYIGKQRVRVGDVWICIKDNDDVVAGNEVRIVDTKTDPCTDNWGTILYVIINSEHDTYYMHSKRSFLKCFKEKRGFLKRLNRNWRQYNVILSLVSLALIIVSLFFSTYTFFTE